MCYSMTLDVCVASERYYQQVYTQLQLLAATLIHPIFRLRPTVSDLV